MSRSYAIYLKERPLKSAFFINTREYPHQGVEFENLLDDVIGNCYHRWGGRTNPIIILDNDIISFDDWELLEQVDVDCIKSFGSLPKDLIQELDRRLQPIDMQVEIPSKGSHIAVHSAGVNCFATPKSLKDIGNPFLIVFDFAKDCDPLVARFVKRNFGSYDQWIDPRNGAVKRNPNIQKLLDDLRIEKILLSDRESLAEALTRLSGSPPGSENQIVQFSPFIMPSGLPSLHLNVHSFYSGDYRVIVGDSYLDVAQFWNGAIWQKSWIYPHTFQLWIPTDLANDPILRNSFYNWLHLHTNAGNSNSKSAKFISRSVSSTDLEVIRSQICDASSSVVSLVVEREELTKEAQERVKREDNSYTFIGIKNKDSTVRISASNDNEVLPIREPEALEKSVSQYAEWVVDLQIELQTPQSESGSEGSWWRLPRINSGGLLAAMFHGGARINCEGLFSVRIEKVPPGAFRHEVKPVLKFQLPTQDDVIRALIVDPYNQPINTADIRYVPTGRHPEIVDVKPSDKGDYLRGLIKVFRNFSNAKDICERKFWNALICKLSDYSARSDEVLSAKVSNLINKNRGMSPEDLSNKILKAVQDRGLKKPCLSFGEIAELLAKLSSQAIDTTSSYVQGNLTVSNQGRAHLSASQMKNGLHKLVNLNILRRGSTLSCRFCGLKSWYHIDQLRQLMNCPGCGHGQSIGANDLGFSLSSLVETGVINGQLAALHAYANLAGNSWVSFIFSPSLELFKRGSTTPWHEVDVFAVCNGDFVIGSVKGGSRPVTQGDFDELIEVATELNPQRAILFLRTENLNENVRRWLSEGRAKLSPRGVSMEIFELFTY